MFGKLSWWGASIAIALLVILIFIITIAVGSGLPEGAAASVNGVLISKDDVANRIRIGAALNPEMATASPLEYRALERATAEQLVSEELERQEAEKRGLTVEQDEVDEIIDQVIDDKYLGSVEKMNEDFTAKGISEDDLRGEVVRRLIHQALLDSLREENPVTEKEVRQEYEAKKDAYVFPERRQIRQIIVADEASAGSALSRIQAGEKFSEVAIQVSTDPKAKQNGGNLGLVSRDNLPEDVANVAFSLEPYVTSQPFKTGQGWRIVQVELVQGASNVTFEEKKDELMLYMGNERLARRYKQYVEEVHESYDIKYDKDYAPKEEDDSDTTSTEGG